MRVPLHKSRERSFDAWHIAWFDPNRAVEVRQIGSDIVQVGEDHNGLLRRWRFIDITDQSFTWLGEVSWDKGSTWTLETRMHASKVLYVKFLHA